MALEDFLKGIEDFTKVEGINARYADYWKAFKQAEDEDKLTEQETGQNPGKADKNSQEYQEAKASKDLYVMYQARTAAKVKSNLATIARDANPKNLVRAAAYTLSHKEGDKNLREMFKDYKLYDQFLHPRKDIEESKARELESEVIKNLPKIITDRIEDKTGDKEFAEKWGKYLAAANRGNGKYIITLIKSEAERIETELTKKSGALVSYIQSNASEDKNYTDFAKTIYVLERDEIDKIKEREDEGYEARMAA